MAALCTAVTACVTLLERLAEGTWLYTPLNSACSPACPSLHACCVCVCVTLHDSVHFTSLYFSNIGGGGTSRDHSRQCEHALE